MRALGVDCPSHGIRILGLTWANIDLANDQLRVRRNLHYTRSELIFETSKTLRSARTILLRKRYVAALATRSLRPWTSSGRR